MKWVTDKGLNWFLPSVLINVLLMQEGHLNVAVLLYLPELDNVVPDTCEMNELCVCNTSHGNCSLYNSAVTRSTWHWQCNQNTMGPDQAGNSDTSHHQSNCSLSNVCPSTEPGNSSPLRKTCALKSYPNPAKSRWSLCVLGTVGL